MTDQTVEADDPRVEAVAQAMREADEWIGDDESKYLARAALAALPAPVREEVLQTIFSTLNGQAEVDAVASFGDLDPVSQKAIGLVADAILALFHQPQEGAGSTGQLLHPPGARDDPAGSAPTPSDHLAIAVGALAEIEAGRTDEEPYEDGAHPPLGSGAARIAARQALAAIKGEMG